jgi:hypothetical protein
LRFLTTPLAVAACLAATNASWPALAQAGRFGASPAEYRTEQEKRRAAEERIGQLEADFVRLSGVFGVPVPTLRAIARGRIKAAPALGITDLRRNMRDLAQEAAALRERVDQLEVMVANLRSEQTTRSASASVLSKIEQARNQLTQASSLIEQGELVEASRLLNDLRQVLTGVNSESGTLLVEVARSAALAAFLGGDIEGSDALLREVSDQIMLGRAKLAWEVEQERGVRLYDVGQDLQEVTLLERSAVVLADRALALSADLSDRERFYTFSYLCRANASVLTEQMDYSPTPSRETRNRFARNEGFCTNASALGHKLETVPPEDLATLHAEAASFVSSLSVHLNDRDAVARSKVFYDRAATLLQDVQNSQTLAKIYFSFSSFEFHRDVADMKPRPVVAPIQSLERAVALVGSALDSGDWASLNQELGAIQVYNFIVSGDYGYLDQAVGPLQAAVNAHRESGREIAEARAIAWLAYAQGRISDHRRDASGLRQAIRDLQAIESTLRQSGAIALVGQVKTFRRELEGRAR